MMSHTPPERTGKFPRPQPQTLTVVLLAALVAMIAWITIDRAGAERQAQVSSDNAASIAQQVKDACDRHGDTAAELGDLCRQAEQVEQEPTETIPGPPGPPGPPGADAPPVSNARIDAAVQRFCSLSGCRGPRGFPGADSTVPGPPGQDSTVPGPVGPPGSDSTVPGPPGPAGADSTVPGPQGDPGRPPTAKEIADAVAAFCAEGACRGAAGGDGDDGRGIVTVTIEGDARQCELVVSYTDDTQDRIPINGLMCVRLSEE